MKKLRKLFKDICDMFNGLVGKVVGFFKRNEEDVVPAIEFAKFMLNVIAVNIVFSIPVVRELVLGMVWVYIFKHLYELSHINY